MRPENKRMQEFLKQNGIKAKVKYIADGSLKHTWRFFNREIPWTEELAVKFNQLGFTDFDRTPLRKYSGNGGVLSIFVRGHYEFLMNQ